MANQSVLLLWNEFSITSIAQAAFFLKNRPDARRFRVRDVEYMISSAHKIAPRLISCYDSRGIGAARQESPVWFCNWLSHHGQGVRLPTTLPQRAAPCAAGNRPCRLRPPLNVCALWGSAFHIMRTSWNTCSLLSF